MFDKIRRISALVYLIILDGIRRHALIGLILFASAGITGGLFFIDFIPRDIGRAANDFFFSISWLTGFIFLLFHAVQVMAWDNERGALHTFLARPITRTEYALALFFGLGSLLLTLNMLLGGIGWGVLNFIRISVDSDFYFPELSIASFSLAVLGLFWIQLTLLSVILLFSSVVRGSLPVLLLTLCYYFICSGLPVVRESLKQKINYDPNEFVNIMLKWMNAIFLDFSWLDFKILVVAKEEISPISQLLTPFLLVSFYILIVLSLACSIYERRDLQ